MDYYNRKGFYSIVLQAVIDSNGKFIDIFVGYPGSTHDSRIFRNSSLYYILSSSFSSSSSIIHIFLVMLVILVKIG